jgi:hypothetical protein
MYKGHCYSINSQLKITWYEAEKKCQAKNAWLVDIRDKNELNFVKNQGLTISGYYIGIREVNGSGVWTYLDGSVMNLTDIWVPGEPNNGGGNEDCGALRASGANSGRLNDVPCNTTYYTLSYICKTSQHRRSSGEPIA